MTTLIPKSFLVLLFAATSGLFAQAPIESTNPAAPATLTESPNPVVWKLGRLGAGGFVTGIDLHPSGDLMLARTDVGGAYKWNDTKKEWVQIATSERLPEGSLGFFEYDGVSSIASAATDKNRVYMAFCGTIYASDDAGETWRAPESGGKGIFMDPNSRVGRLQGERLAIDPRNKDFAFYGSGKSGLIFTVDGGKNWQSIPATQVPFGKSATSKQSKKSQFFPGVGQVLFDPSSPEIGGKTSRIYATVWGEGLFESADAGATWKQIGADKNLASIESAAIANDGTLLLAQDVAQNAFLLRNGQLTEMVLPRKQAWTEAVIDPKNSARMFLFGAGVIGAARQARSLDGGQTWTSIAHKTLVADDIPWLAKEAYFSTGAIKFDAVKEDRLWIAQGVGVWYSDDALTAKDITWNSQSAGIEELVVNEILVPEPGKPVIANWDRAIFKVDDVNAYPQTWGPVEEFSSGWDLDLMASNPKSMVGIFQGQANNPHAGVMLSGYSDDGGRSWTPFAFEKFPFDVKDPYVWVYGNIAVSSQDPNKIVWFTVGENGVFLYTNDRGKTWEESEFEGGVEKGSWNRASFFYKQAVVADPVDGNTFYAYNWTNKNLYRSQDGGKTFQIMSKVPSTKGDFHCKLRAVPGKTGHLYFTAGLNSNQGKWSDMGPLYFSSDAGETWEVVSGTEAMIDIAFGAPALGSSLPTYYASGGMMGPDGIVWGIFRSLDEGKTWEKISGLYPMGVTKGQSKLAADPGIYGRIYLGTSGVGYYVGDLPH